MLTPIEWIVVVFAAISLVKIAVLVVDRKQWWPVTKMVYGHKVVSGLVFIILALVVLSYLLQELSIVQILASGAFVALVVGIGFLEFFPGLLDMAKKMLKQGFSFWTWLYMLAWVVLFAWALYEIFM